MRDVLEAIHDYPDEALGLFFFLIVYVNKSHESFIRRDYG